MIKRLHEHIIQELDQNARAEIVFVGIAVALNFLTMGINSGLASARGSDVSMAVLVVTMALVLTVNWVAFSGLRKGREVKIKLLNGLMKMYRDEKVEEYYDISLLDAYKARFIQYLIGVFATGIASILVPIIILIID